MRVSLGCTCVSNDFHLIKRVRGCFSNDTMMADKYEGVTTITIRTFEVIRRVFSPQSTLIIS
jgi:hypothetical protein